MTTMSEAAAIDLPGPDVGTTGGDHRAGEPQYVSDCCGEPARMESGEQWVAWACVACGNPCDTHLVPACFICGEPSDDLLDVEMLGKSMCKEKVGCYHRWLRKVQAAG